MIAPPTSASARRPHWPGFLLVLLGVPAIVIGLLGMHTLTDDTGGGTDAVPVATVAELMPAMIALVSTVPGATMTADMGMSASGLCSVPCEPDHEMLGSACVLALLITVLLFTLHLVLTSRKEPRRDALMVVARMVTLAAVAPPSLHVLSISRT